MGIVGSGESSERCEPYRARVDRWRTSASVLDEVRRSPGLTRVELATRLNLSSATTTETVARLRESGWLCEDRAPISGRGRPTTCLRPAPDGPRVLALDLRHEDWRLAVAGLDGVPTVLCSGRRGDDLTEQLRRAIGAAAPAAPGTNDSFVASTGTNESFVPNGSGGRPPLALGLAVPAPLSDDVFVRATELDWAPIAADLVAGPDHPEIPVLPGNDATLAGLAEARTGAAVGAGTALSLTVEVGIGGTLLLDGRPQLGAHGAAGEFGHLPFGDPAIPCACGAWGCWAPELDGRALARHLGVDPPADPRTFATEILDRADAGDEAALAAVARVAAALGRGVAGLVNAHDPEVVVLGGLAPRLRGPAFDEAYERGLMAFRRADPTPVLDGVHGDDAPLDGAVALALDDVTSAEGLARAIG
ncbi:ROK family transcriptional regulator [Actinomycetospora endophytica]|uniref:ROK family transcriptional regulator n=1 Tax=Actinomycetospora endophytica TaxID=2291215 RepID=A0ABS8PIG7_9PSEU|nr:ROK family transcriptional regulator [Actinomycetospora endophytica]MCD2197186.1 ROK family transcriptional regulator [Actinomycetospora endophytica]